MSWAVAVALIAGALGAAQNPHASVQILALAVTVIVAIVLLRSRLHETRRPDVELYDDVMVLPTRGARSRTVQYESLRAAVTRGKAPRDELVLEAGGHTYIYPRGSFEDEDGMDVFFLQLRNRLRSHPRGAQIVAEIRHRQNITQRLSRMRPRVTHGLIALIAVVFMLQMYLGSGGYDPVVATVLGANLSSRTLSGEWYRLITANFLHGGMLHIYLNCLALLSLGGALERLLGRWTYLTVFMVSAVGGALASALYNPGVPSQGVSTAVFGLLGAFGVLHLLKALPIGYRQTRGWWTFTLGVNAVLPLIVDVIDVAAHVGGFAVGAAVAYLVLRKRGAQASKGDQALRRPALVLAATYLLAFVWAGSSALAFDARDKAELTD
ncbi:MAG: rhomboid family intramembrane serine protease, partial [Myxococcota bacterium]